MRLNSYLAKCGVASRRKADQLIASGRVKVNGAIVSQLGTRLDPANDHIQVDNSLIKPIEKQVYILLNKPSGYISTVKDQFRRNTVMDLIPNIPGIAPVGRLDLSTEGVLLLTNDGILAHRLTHPRYEIKKTYLVMLNQDLGANVLTALAKGVNIGEETHAYAHDIEKVNKKCVRLSIHEGRKRQIRRMFKNLGYEVNLLRREQFAFLRADDLEPGTWRYLNDAEIIRMKKELDLA